MDMEEFQRFPGNLSGMSRDDSYPVGMGYVPWQHWHTVYDLDKALAAGTIFPELNKPFCGIRGGCR